MSAARISGSANHSVLAGYERYADFIGWTCSLAANEQQRIRKKLNPKTSVSIGIRAIRP
jgi:hypothetical protein